MADMQFGLMIRGQFPQEEDMRIRFAEMIEQVRLIDKLGFASLTKGMHYSSSPMQVFNQMIFHSRMAAEATADGLRAIAEAVSEEGGKDAMVQRLADKYVSELAEMAKQSNLVIVPDRPNDISGVVASAMGMFDQVKQQAAGATPSTTGTTKAGANRFHDDKSNYTGAHRLQVARRPPHQPAAGGRLPRAPCAARAPLVRSVPLRPSR